MNVSPHPHVAPALGFVNSNLSPMMSSTQLTLVPSRYIMLFPHTIILAPPTVMTSSEANGGSCVGSIEYLSPLHPPPFTLTSSEEPLCICDSRERRAAAFAQKERGDVAICKLG